MSAFGYANLASVEIPTGTICEDGIIATVIMPYPDALAWAQTVDLATAAEPVRALAEGILAVDLQNGG